MMWTALLPVLSGLAAQLPPGGVSFEGPPALIKALATANGALIHAGQCDKASYSGGLEETGQGKAWRRYEAAFAVASAIWGFDAFPGFDGPKFGPLRCRPADIARMAKEAGAAVDHAEQVLAEATAPLTHGAWAGPIKLCRDTVASAEPGIEGQLGQPMVLITLRPAAAAQFASLTERLTSWWIELRLDGEVISAPGIYGTIDNGEFQITGPQPSELARVIEAVAEPC